LSEVNSVSGKQGDFTVELLQHPRYVDVDKCIACGLCAEKCPKKVDDLYNEGLEKRKAIYVPYSQAVPLKYAIDASQCIFLTKGKCGACEKNCPAGAINFKDTEKLVEIKVGSVILATGFDSYDPSSLDYYNYTTCDDVVTSLEFERILSATGPYQGHLLRPSSKKKPKDEGRPPAKIAWLQCVGSRDINRSGHNYCSSVCCMYAVKQAVMAKDHSSVPLDCAIFYMDMRTQGKDFDRYYENAKKNGVRFVNTRVHTIQRENDSDNLTLRYVEENGSIREEVYDMVVLSTGLVINASTVDLAKRLGITLGDDNFVKASSFSPVSTSVDGIYACGVLTGPKDIPQSVMEASAAACAATVDLASSRGSLIRHEEAPQERNIERQKARIGVFVCNCGINIGGIVRVPEVAQYAATLPDVVYVEENLFSCSQDIQDKMTQVIIDQGLNRVVIAACTPRTHEGLFQQTLINAGLNKYLVEMANIRNQDSWVHSGEPDLATEKAKDLVRMAVAKVRLSSPLAQQPLGVNRSALVIGGGLTGMISALTLARQGFPVHLVEKKDVLGGNARLLNNTWQGEPIGDKLEKILSDIRADERINVHLSTSIKHVEGFVGNFKTEIVEDDTPFTIEHGVAIVATGAKESKPKEYLYGEHGGVVTNLELDAMIRTNDHKLRNADNILFIQCVGSRDENRPYCSKVCCTHTIKNALALQEINPDARIFVLYRDIRTYGQRESLYLEARKKGIIFSKYEPERKPEVISDGQHLEVLFHDPVLNGNISVRADLVCLAAAIESYHDESLAQFFKVPMDKDGWLLEAHQKLRPVEFATEGVFLCGMAHYPKPIEESISQALAATSRALTVLTRDQIMVGGVVSRINPELCCGCHGCINVCPYGAISYNVGLRVAEVNAALCKGCGACAAACPSEAPMLMGFNNEQLYAEIKMALCS
jgi:heterodisulfide reductase subunit A